MAVNKEQYRKCRDELVNDIWAAINKARETYGMKPDAENINWTNTRVSDLIPEVMSAFPEGE